MQNKKVAYYVRHVGTLLAITLVVGLLLSLVNSVTTPVIYQRQQASLNAAMGQVLPEADMFSEVPYDGREVNAVYAAYQSSELLGYCVDMSLTGYSEGLNVVVVVDNTGAVYSLTVLSHSETPGYGTKAADDPAFLDQFIGLSEPVQKGIHVDAVSGATYTSDALIDGVNRALNAVNRIMEGDVDDAGAV